MTIDARDTAPRTETPAMSNQSGKRPKRPARSGTIAALDVGTTKVSCFIGRADDQGRIRLIGAGHQISR
ncbi:hypothetical protein ACJEM9_24460, partial [Escherichia coli]